MTEKAKLSAKERAEAKVKAQVEKLAQAKARLRLAEAAERKRDADKNRRRETRQKVLVGAFILDQIAKSEVSPDKLIFDGKKFSDWLTRADEREVFGLAPKAST